MLRNPLVLCFALAAIFVAAPVASAQAPGDSTSSWYGVLQLAYERGGERINQDPNDLSGDGVPAGGGLSVAVGAEYRSRSRPWLALRGTIGRRFNGEETGPRETRLNTTFVQFQASQVSAKGLRAGVGIAMHLDPTVSGFGLPARELDSAFGPFIELGTKLVAFRSTVMKYTTSDGRSYSAFSNGIVVSFVVCDIFERRDLPDSRRCL